MGSHERIFVLSDLHIAPPSRLSNFNAGPELVAFLNHLPAGSTLVLAGDTFDFLELPNRPGTLHLATAPDLCERLLDGIETKHPWGPAFFAALGSLGERNIRCVLLPGNHDPELYHPDAEVVLQKKIGLNGHDPALSIHRASGAWRAEVGGQKVIVLHGHLEDDWNRIDPDTVHRALAQGKASLPLPPGSLLVLETINAYERAMDLEGRPRFPFVSLLKPEGPWVPLLLLALDPGLARRHIPSFAGHGFTALLRALRHRVVGGGPFLGRGVRGPSAASEEGAFERRSDEEEAGSFDWADELAGAIDEALTPEERASPELTLDRLEHSLRSGDEVAVRSGYLSGGFGMPAGPLLRAAWRKWHDGGKFFDTAAPSDHDRALIQKYLPHDVRNTIVVNGHTHAAREEHLSGFRTYLNTGTWTDLMGVPEKGDTETLEGWLGQLRSGAAPQRKRRHYAEIRPEGGRLGEWKGIGA